MSTLSRRLEFVKLFGRFLISGVPGALLYAGAAYVCIVWLGMQDVYGYAVAQILNSILNFVIQKEWVFEDGSRYSVRQMLLYAFASGLYQIIAFAVIWIIRFVLPTVPSVWLAIIAIPIKSSIAFCIVRPIFQSIKKDRP